MPSPSTQILLIEEDPTLLAITAFRLELLGHELVSLQTAHEASQWLEKQLPDLVAVGHLADTEPIDFLNRLSNEERTSNLPVIYLSACTDLEEVQRAFNAGADEYLITPYDPLMLENKIEGLLHAASGRGEG